MTCTPARIRGRMGMGSVRDSVDVALELDERGVYSHIAHESAEDIKRIIASIDAERAELAGVHVYYHDDWDELIRERIRKGKRHTAFDFYNPELMSIWESKVEELRARKRRRMVWYAVIIVFMAITAMVSWLLRGSFSYTFLLGVSVFPFLYMQRTRFRTRRDLIYHELAQFFIDELGEIVKKHGLDPWRYRFKIFNRDYFGVRVEKTGGEVYATVNVGDGGESGGHGDG